MLCKVHKCRIRMHQARNKILTFTQNHKSMKIPFVINAVMVCLLEKICSCDNDQTRTFMSKTNKHTPFGYSLFPHCSFDNNKNNHDFYRGEDFIKKFYVNLKDHATKIINCDK